LAGAEIWVEKPAAAPAAQTKARISKRADSVPLCLIAAT